MFNKALIFAAAGLCLGATPALAATTIDFETDGMGATPVVNAPLGANYADLGLVFTDAEYKRCGGGCPTPISGFFISSVDFSSPFSVLFSSTANAFSFSNVTNSSGTASAFDAMGNLLSSVNFSGFNIGAPDSNNFSLSGANIKTITFSGDQYGVDNFSFSLNDVQSGVPEPSTWALMLLGFAAIGGALRNRKSRVSAVSYS